MKQKKLLICGIVLAGVMLTMEMAPSLLLGNGFTFASLLMTCIMPAAVCGILAAAVCEKRVLGIISSAVVLLVRAISLINYCNIIVRYGFDASFLFSLVMQQVYMVVAVLWLLRYILNRPMRAALIALAIVGAALDGMSFSADLVLETVNAVKGYTYPEMLITILCYGVSNLAFWAICLLTAFGQPGRAKKPAAPMAEACAEEAGEPDTVVLEETVPEAASVQEETVSETAPVQEEPVPSENALDALERLAALRERGILTEAEFESKKAELLSKI